LSHEQELQMVEQGVGARLLRKEDDRLMRGRGEFVADIRLAGLQDVAFVRSPLAHARIRNISIPPKYADRVFVSGDLKGVKPIRAVSALPGFKIYEQPILDADVSVISQKPGRYILRDNENTEVVSDGLLPPAFCLRAGTRYDAGASILPQAEAA